MPEDVSTTTQQLVILFEGSWFLIEDPADSTRVLAICPYVNAPDHACSYGFWNGETIAGPNATGPAGVMPEGQSLWVDIVTDRARNAASVQTLFKTAHDIYPFPYLTSADPVNDPLQLSDTTGMRRVSISMPNSLRAEGLLTNATVYGSQSTGTTIKLESGSSYVDLLFIYEYDTLAEVDMGTEFFKQQVFSTTTTMDLPPHLIFKVMGTAMEAEDIASECAHVVQTFNSLRRIVHTSNETYCDVAIYPTPGEWLQFSIEDTSFSPAELGIPAETVPMPRIRDYASCAAGPVVGGGGLG